MSDEVLEQELRLLAAATERKEQLIENAKERLKTLEELKDEGERVQRKIQKLINELEVRIYSDESWSECVWCRKDAN